MAVTARIAGAVVRPVQVPMHRSPAAFAAFEHRVAS
jgi:hypothetical protein